MRVFLFLHGCWCMSVQGLWNWLTVGDAKLIRYILEICIQFIPCFSFCNIIECVFSTLVCCSIHSSLLAGSLQRDFLCGHACQWGGIRLAGRPWKQYFWEEWVRVALHSRIVHRMQLREHFFDFMNAVPCVFAWNMPSCQWIFLEKNSVHTFPLKKYADEIWDMSTLA